MHTDDQLIEDAVLSLLKSQALKLQSCNILQSLWAGYGRICHVTALPTTSGSGHKDNPVSLILKYITPPSTKTRDGDVFPDEGHIRKILSYQVEQYFYTHLAPRLPPDIAVARCIASISNAAGPDNTTGSSITSSTSSGTAMLLTDLRDSFPIAGEKRAQLTEPQVHAALRWLGGFHGFWWKNLDETIDRTSLVQPPLVHFAQHKHTNLPGGGGIWLNGGYTYLSTRQTEHATIAKDTSSEWSLPLTSPISLPNTMSSSSIANLVAQFLNPSATSKPSSSSHYETVIHGDVKSENLFTTPSGSTAAFFDFQYVGLGLGASDLAKLLTCSVPASLLLPPPSPSSSNDSPPHDPIRLPMSPGEKHLLETYLATLRSTSGKTYPWPLFVRHWETALVDWLRFQAGWGFWGNTPWLEGRVRSILADEDWKTWLTEQTTASKS